MKLKRFNRTIEGRGGYFFLYALSKSAINSKKKLYNSDNYNNKSDKITKRNILHKHHPLARAKSVTAVPLTVPEKLITQIAEFVKFCNLKFFQFFSKNLLTNPFHLCIIADVD